MRCSVTVARRRRPRPTGIEEADPHIQFAQSFAEFPQMQQSASFNLDAIKEQMHKASSAHAA